MLVWVFTSMISCRKEITKTNAASSYTGSNFSDVFESFWNGMNNNYVFWDIDTTNWDNVYSTYKPLFSKLNLYNSNDILKSVDYFNAMTSGLVDSHYTLTFYDVADSSGNYYQISPAANRKYNKWGYLKNIPSSLFDSIIPLKYLDKSSIHAGTDSVVLGSSYEQMFVISGTINNKILYLHFNMFALQQAGTNVQPVLNYFFNTVANLPSSINGIIIDVRQNGGGEITDLNFLLGRMTTSQYTFGYTRSKNGNGRLDYTPWAPAMVTPQSGAANITKPIVMLADGNSASMAEITTMAIKSLNNGKFVGDTTWGATGPLAPNVYYNGGQFDAGNFVNVYTSSTMLKYKDGKIYEGKGFPPDYEINYTTQVAGVKSGTDPQLEKAISVIGN
jgi:hypothetical protein